LLFAELLPLPKGAGQNVDALVQRQMADARAAVHGTADRQLLLLGVEYERARLTGLESKGLAVAALPSVVGAFALAVIGHGRGSDWLCAVCIFYVACALVSAAQVIRPAPRASYTPERTAEADPLEYLVAMTTVNRTVALHVNNLVSAAVEDTAKAGFWLTVALAVAWATPAAGVQRAPTCTVIEHHNAAAQRSTYDSIDQANRHCPRSGSRLEKCRPKRQGVTDKMNKPCGLHIGPAK
jgi:hypothetical protein